MKSRTATWAEYGAYLAASTLIRVLPRPMVLAAGATLGRAFHRLDRRHRRIAQENLRAAELSPELSRAVFQHLGRITLDSIFLWTRTERALDEIVQVEGARHMQEALSRGGVVLFTAHFGNWEVGAAVTAHLFGQSLVIARALDNPLLERNLRGCRERCGNRVVEKRESARPALRELQNGGIVAILIDQRVGPEEGVPSTFLGRPVYATAAAVRLAQKTGASLVPGFCTYVEKELAYQATYLPPIPTQDANGEPRALEAIVQDCNDVLSAAIRTHPEQWLWVHDRWRDSGP